MYRVACRYALTRLLNVISQAGTSLKAPKAPESATSCFQDFAPREGHERSNDDQKNGSSQIVRSFPRGKAYNGRIGSGAPPVSREEQAT